MNPLPTTQPFVFQPAVVTAGADEPMIGAPRSPSQDSLVHDTRREISEIIREVAAATRSDRTIGQFSSLLADRVLCAMAAEGVVIWHRESERAEADFVPIGRCGQATDRTIPSAGAATHQAMLREVAREGIPVVVPATPGASEVSIPANPTDVPVAVVPIDSDPTSAETAYLLEVFLEPEGGITTQRGYLRFAVQMADLAGEFLRAAELRRLKRSAITSHRVDAAISQLHRAVRPEQVQAAIVDAAAEAFDFERVALCIIDAPHSTLAAVSHVNKIDHRSDGARYLVDAAEMSLTDGIGLIDDDEVSSTIVVAPTDTRSSLRLVAICDADVAIENKEQLRRYVDHAAVSLRNASQFDAIPGGRLLASLAPALQSGQIKWWMRPIFTACVLTMLMIGAMLPVPMYVHSTATIRPAEMQRLTAPRNAIVQQLHVQHGQTVSRGDALVTLSDSDLEQQITQLMGRRSVLIEKLARGRKLLMGATSGDRDWSMQLQGEQSLTEVDLDAVDHELAQLQRIKANLVIRSDRSGTVDAWRIKERLEGRPLTQGDPLMRIVATDSPWFVDVLVPQNRIASVRQAIAKQTLDVQVALESTPQIRWPARLKAIGPTTVQPITGIRASSVRLQLAPETMSEMMQTEAMGRDGFARQASNLSIHSGSSSRPGVWATDAPATAVFHCGRRPAAYILFQDAFAAVRSTAGLYLGTGEDLERHGESNEK